MYTVLAPGVCRLLLSYLMKSMGATASLCMIMTSVDLCRCDWCLCIFTLCLSNPSACPHGASEWQQCQTRTPSAPACVEHAQTRTTFNHSMKAKQHSACVSERRETMHVMLPLPYYTWHVVIPFVQTGKWRLSLLNFVSFSCLQHRFGFIPMRVNTCDLISEVKTVFICFPLPPMSGN